MGKGCTVTLRKGREKPILGGHPWVFSGAIKDVAGYRDGGDVCTVTDETGRFVAKGYVNTRSRITVRVLSLEDVEIDERFVSDSLKNAFLLRERLAIGDAGAGRGGAPSPGANGPAGALAAFRAVNAEGDFLPGLVVDRYGRGLVLQALTAGAQRLKGLFVDGLSRLYEPSFIYEKADAQSASLEGYEPAEGYVRGKPCGPVEIEEDGARFRVDVEKGQKTGFYLDQRRNRGIVKRIAGGASVLNCFSYTGGFGVQAVLGGARSAVNVDLSERALEGARENAALNGIEPAVFSLVRDDVFEYLRKDGDDYDIVVLDPPKFAGSAAELEGAARGYKDINLNGLRRVKPSGFLATFSCSGAVSEDLFQKIVFGAAKDAGRRVQAVCRLRADDDHPFNLAHREGEYLKGLLLRVL